MCRINPRVDFAFKKLFGYDKNDCLIYDVRLQTIATIESQIASALEKGL